MISRDYPEGTPITEDIIKRLQEEAREMPIAGADILEVVRTGVLVDDKPKSGREEIEGSNLKMSLKLIVARDDLKKCVPLFLRRAFGSALYSYYVVYCLCGVE